MCQRFSKSMSSVQEKISGNKKDTIHGFVDGRSSASRRAESIKIKNRGPEMQCYIEISVEI